MPAGPAHRSLEPVQLTKLLRAGAIADEMPTVVVATVIPDVPSVAARRWRCSPGLPQRVEKSQRPAASVSYRRGLHPKIQAVKAEGVAAGVNVAGPDNGR
jgi:hypothetical protein